MRAARAELNLPLNWVAGRVIPCAPLPTVTRAARAERRALPSPGFRVGAARWARHIQSPLPLVVGTEA